MNFSSPGRAAPEAQQRGGLVPRHPTSASPSLVPRLLMGPARWLLQKYWRWQRAMTLGVRGMVIDPDGRILLVRHTYTPGWNLPGGGVEFGETLEASLERELEEEAGVVLNGPPGLVGIFSNHAAFPGDHVAVYVVRHWRRSRIPEPNMEIAETAFFHADALPGTLVPGARRRIEEVLGRRTPDSLW